MVVRYHTSVKVKSINEVKEKLNWRKDETGQSIYDEVSKGWAVRFENSSAMIFPYRPEWSVGDKILLSMEKEVA